MAVAPHIGSWIEIEMVLKLMMPHLVAPYIGVWIEILIEEVMHTWYIGSHLLLDVD